MAVLSQLGNKMEKDIIRENYELRLSLFQAQAQVLTLQNEKLEAMFQETKKEYEAYLNSKEQNEADK